MKTTLLIFPYSSSLLSQALVANEMAGRKLTNLPVESGTAVLAQLGREGREVGRGREGGREGGRKGGDTHTQSVIHLFAS